jgi:uncharacterized oligopeptide transporter (OPT) family protein
MVDPASPSRTRTLPPAVSLVRAGVGARLGVAAGVGALVWIVIAWSLAA